MARHPSHKGAGMWCPRPLGNFAELSNLGQTGRSVVSLDTVFPTRDSSLWTVVRLALWLVYGSLSVARLTGLLHSTMTSA